MDSQVTCPACGSANTVRVDNGKHRCQLCGWTFKPIEVPPGGFDLGMAPTLAALDDGPGAARAGPFGAAPTPPKTMVVGPPAGGPAPMPPWAPGPAAGPAPLQGNPFAPPRSNLLEAPAHHVESSGLKVAAIFNIVLGVLTFGWTFIWIAEIVLFATGQIEPEGGDEASNVVAMVMVVFLTLFSIGAGVVHMIAGIRLLKLQPGARGLAIAAGVAGICSVWTCCLWPLAIGAGITTLVVVLGDAGKQHLP